MNKIIIKYFLLFCMASLIAYKSVYFKKLDSPETKTENTKINPSAFARKFWNTSFNKAIDSAITLEVFEKEFIEKGALPTITKYSHSQGVSDVSYILMKFTGKVKEIRKDKIVLEILNSRTISYEFNIGNYFGNAVRDVTGLINMGDFINSTEYNEVSSELNKIVKSEVIMPIKNNIKLNDNLTIVGCVEVKYGRLSGEILPVKIIIK